MLSDWNENKGLSDLDSCYNYYEFLLKDQYVKRITFGIFLKNRMIGMIDLNLLNNDEGDLDFFLA